MSNRSIAIIICTTDRADSLRRTLESIGETEVPAGWDVELLVVDNGSTDDTPAVVGATALPRIHVNYLYESARGKSGALNRGLAATSSEVILFTDDDVRVPADWISAMAGPILTDEADAVQGTIRPAPHLERAWLKGIYRTMLSVVEPGVGETPRTLVGASMAIGRHVLQRVSGFSVELGPGAAGLCDDTLLGFQLARAGYRLAYAKGGDVEHHFDERRLGATFFYDWVTKAGKSNAIMYMRHLGDTPGFARDTWALTMTKYLARRAIDWRRNPVPPEWVMYYRWRAAYAAECAAMRKASFDRTSEGERSPVMPSAGH